MDRLSTNPHALARTSAAFLRITGIHNCANSRGSQIIPEAGARCILNKMNRHGRCAPPSIANQHHGCCQMMVPRRGKANTGLLLIKDLPLPASTTNEEFEAEKDQQKWVFCTTCPSPPNQCPSKTTASMRMGVVVAQLQPTLPQPTTSTPLPLRKATAALSVRAISGVSEGRQFPRSLRCFADRVISS